MPKHSNKITGLELTDVIKNTKKTFQTYAGIVVGNVFGISSFNEITKGITFENCTFTNPCIVSGNLKCGIKFINCIFKNSLSFHNIVIDDFDMRQNFDDDSILISNCTINESLIFHDHNYVIKSTIIKKCSINYINISGLVSNEGGLKLRENNIKNRCEIDNCNLINDINIVKTSFSDRLAISFNKCSSIHLSDNTCKSDAWLFDNILKHNFILNNGFYSDRVIVEACSIPEQFNVYNATFENQFFVTFSSFANKEIADKDISNIYIHSCSFANGFLVSGGSKGRFHSDVKSIHLIASKKLSGEIIFDQLNINLLRIEGSNFDASIFFKHCLFSLFQISKFTNFGSLHLINSKALPTDVTDSNFQISDSYLGKSNFSNFSFKNFNKVQINNSDLTNISASSVTWFTLNQIDFPSLYKSKNPIRNMWPFVKNCLFNNTEINELVQEFRQNRELFRQLKYAMEQQGNRIQSLVFKQYEMTFFRKELILTKKFWNFDRLILGLSCSNNHGQNWIKPMLILTLIATPIFAFLLIIAYNSGFSNLASTISDYKRAYPNLLNPVFSLKDIFGEQTFSGWIVSLAVLYRIIYAYLVFQTVSAFRKYIK